MNENNTAKEQKKLLASIGAKIIIMIVLALLVAVTVIILLIVPGAKTSIQTAIENNMLDLATNYSEFVDTAVEDSADGTLTSEQLANILSPAGIKGYDSSYAYLVDTDGVFLYHKKDEKIGTVVINDKINTLLSEIPTGNYEKNGIFHYTDENGLEKYGSYCVSDVNHWTVVVLASESDIMATIDGIRDRAIVGEIIIVIVCGLIAFVYSRSITQPIKKLTAMISRTADLDFTVDESVQALQNRSDETGEMCRASLKMQDNLREMVSKMEYISGKLTNNASELKDIAIVINDASDNNSATSEELAAYMQETSATTENIDTNIEQISTNTNTIADMSMDGMNITNQLMNRASEMKQQSEETKTNAMEMCDKVKTKSEESIEKSKAVEKINMLTSTIMSISEQTSLLALNASIEAARAGEQGKGFAVVAGEIGNLANQSSTAVQSIVDIVKEVQDAVQDMTECLAMTSEFIETSVIPDYETFLQGSIVYNNDANEVKGSMTQIKEHIDELQKSSEMIAQSISDINNTIGEEAEGVTDIAQKTTEVVASMHQVREMVDATSDYAEELKEIVDSFQL